MFEQLFEEIVARCLEAGLVQGDNLSVDGSFVEANANKGSRIPREQFAEAARVNQIVRQYLMEVEQQNPTEEPEHQQEQVSTTDPHHAGRNTLIFDLSDVIITGHSAENPGQQVQSRRTHFHSEIGAHRLRDTQERTHGWHNAWSHGFGIPRPRSSKYAVQPAPNRSSRIGADTGPALSWTPRLYGRRAEEAHRCRTR